MRAVLLILLAFAPLAASATADGPDFFRVEIEGGGAIVDLFETPGGAGALLASVPDGTDGLANRGCEGGLSYADWAQASEAERAEAAGQRWCRVVYGPFEGWVQGLYLREGNPPQDARAPSFDCAEARSSAEIAVCRSDHLATLDLEVARLYRLAQRGPSIGERGAELRAMQRGWIKGRDDCWKAGAGIADCIAFAQLSRIEALRSGYADARQEDAAGISLGPLPYTCEGFDMAVRATFVQTPAPMALIAWGTSAEALTLSPAASGARYVGGETAFWTKGTGEGAEALLSLPGRAAMRCRGDATD